MVDDNLVRSAPLLSGEAKAVFGEEVGVVALGRSLFECRSGREWERREVGRKGREVSTLRRSSTNYQIWKTKGNAPERHTAKSAGS